MSKVVGPNFEMRRSVAAPALFVCAFSLLSISGCAINGKGGIPDDLISSDQIVTNSVAKAARVEGIDESDAELIKTTIANPALKNGKQSLSWKNTETGSSGTVIDVNSFKGQHGQQCRGFKTSVDSFAGISYYNGEACQVTDEKWVLSWFKPAE